MGLIVPRWGFKHHASRWTQNGATAANSVGPTVTSGAANTKGSTQSILTTIDFDVHCIAVAAAGGNASGAVKSTLLDIMFDPAGGTSWNVLVANLLFGQEIGIGTIGTHSHVYIFPLYVKSGASFGARAQNSTASSTMDVLLWVWGEPSRPEMWWCGSAVETLGANTGTSSGVSLQPGNGAWTVTASTPGTTGQRYGAYQLGLGTNDVYTAVRNVVFSIMQASTGNNQRTGTNYHLANFASTETSVWGLPIVPNFCDIPASTAIHVSGWQATGTDTWAVTFYGVY